MWTQIPEPAAAAMRDKLGPSHEHVAELESIVTALGHLPDTTETDDAKLRERQREKEIVKRRLSALADASPETGDAIQAALAQINGEPGNPRSFDRLERFLHSETYRLRVWRVPTDEIHYRPLFRINRPVAIVGASPPDF